MRTRILVRTATVLVAALPCFVRAQDAVPHRTIAFTTSEGTWISLDASPDGRTLVFEARR